MGGVTARDPALARVLRERLSGEIREDEPLARYSTYRIGGPATVVLPAVPEDVGAALQFAAEEGVPWFAVGLGSNLLFPDGGLDALVIRIGKGLDRVETRQDLWQLGAGLPAPLAARRTAQAGFAGLHKFVGVPGSVGGGVYMNAGCHGVEWSDVVERVLVVDWRGEDYWLERREVGFSYRRSGLEGRIVLETEVRLREEPRDKVNAEIVECFEWRQAGTPFNQPCCGSVFKNPGGASWKQADGPRTAGQLIEAAGLKGTRIGGAEISPMHANYFINTGSASAADVRGLIDLARRTVQERYGVTLETEVKLIGTNGEYQAVADA